METITAYSQDMSVFLNESELTERRAFIESFVKEIVVQPGNALLRYTIPMPEDSPIGDSDAEELALHAPVLSTVKSGRSQLGCQLTLCANRVPPSSPARYGLLFSAVSVWGSPSSLSSNPAQDPSEQLADYPLTRTI